MQKVISSISLDYDPLKDPNYMSPSMIFYFKQLLDTVHQNLLEEENEISLSLIDNPNVEIDILDRGATEELTYKNFTYQEYKDRIRLEVKDALQRIRAGSYGYCEKTKEEIGVSRLLAVPYARYTREVQEHHERNNLFIPPHRT